MYQEQDNILNDLGYIDDEEMRQDDDNYFGAFIDPAYSPRLRAQLDAMERSERLGKEDEDETVTETDLPDSSIVVSSRQDGPSISRLSTS